MVLVGMDHFLIWRSESAFDSTLTRRESFGQSILLVDRNRDLGVRDLSALALDSVLRRSRIRQMILVKTETRVADSR